LWPGRAGTNANIRTYRHTATHRHAHAATHRHACAATHRHACADDNTCAHHHSNNIG
jgi:hypothetical protein